MTFNRLLAEKWASEKARLSLIGQPIFEFGYLLVEQEQVGY
jgi:hypothetical protein